MINSRLTVPKSVDTLEEVMLDVQPIRDLVLSLDPDSFPNGKIVACVAKLGKSQWVAANNRKTHPCGWKKFKNGQEASCTHAEMQSLHKIPRQSRPFVELFVMRFLKNGILSMAQPCERCQKMLRQNGVKYIYYTDWEGRWCKFRW